MRHVALAAGVALAAVAPAVHSSDFLDGCLAAIATYPVVPVAWIHGDDAAQWPARHEALADFTPTADPAGGAISPVQVPMADVEQRTRVANRVDSRRAATAEPLDLLVGAAVPLLLREWVHGSEPIADDAIEAAAAESAVLVAANDASCAPLLQQTFNLLQTGEPQSLCRYQGKVLLIVNTASYCGYTKQYQALEALYRNNKDKGLVVIGFPSNDFGGQEPGTNKEVAEFCRTTYGVEFPMYEKSSVSGAGTLAGNALYASLAKQTGKTPQWNFHKYVVDRSGTPVASFGSAVTPDDRDLVKLLERLLNEKPTSAKG